MNLFLKAVGCGTLIGFGLLSYLWYKETFTRTYHVVDNN